MNCLSGNWVNILSIGFVTILLCLKSILGFDGIKFELELTINA